jgi:AcrR family transcriptional regulator
MAVLVGLLRCARRLPARVLTYQRELEYHLVCKYEEYDDAGGYPVTMEPTTETAPETRRRLSREQARQQTRQRLLDAAADVFKRLGYHGATLEAVAEAAGYTKGAVYSNFDTKADLFQALLDRYVQAEISSQEQQFAGMTLEEAIDSLEAIFERQIRSDPLWTVLRMEFWLVASRDSEVRRRLVAKAEPFRQRAGEVIDDLLSGAGQTPPFTGRELGILVNALVTGLAVVRQHEPDAVDPKLLVRAVRQLAGLDREASNDGGGVVSGSPPSRNRRRRERPG